MWALVERASRLVSTLCERAGFSRAEKPASEPPTIDLNSPSGVEMIFAFEAPAGDFEFDRIAAQIARYTESFQMRAPIALCDRYCGMLARHAFNECGLSEREAARGVELSKRHLLARCEYGQGLSLDERNELLHLMEGAATKRVEVGFASMQRPVADETRSHSPERVPEQLIRSDIVRTIEDVLPRVQLDLTPQSIRALAPSGDADLDLLRARVQLEQNSLAPELLPFVSELTLYWEDVAAYDIEAPAHEKRTRTLVGSRFKS